MKTTTVLDLDDLSRRAVVAQRGQLPLVCSFIAVAMFFGGSVGGHAATLAEEVARFATPLVDASGATPEKAVGLVVVVERQLQPTFQVVRRRSCANSGSG